MRKHDIRRGFESKEHEKRLEQVESEVKNRVRNRKGDERENQGDTYPESLMTEEEEENVVSFARRRLNK